MEYLTIKYDNFARESWTETEQQNVRTMINFVQHLMNNHDFDYVRENFMNGAYTQHNRSIPDGMTNIIDYVEAFTKSFPEYTYDVKNIYADGNFVIFHSHATLKATHRSNDRKGMNIIDIWKLENGQIVEHWDAIQPLDLFMRFYVFITGGGVKNNNGVF